MSFWGILLTKIEDPKAPSFAGSGEFFATTFIGAAVVVIAYFMVRSVRRINYRAEIQEKLAAEMAAGAHDGAGVAMPGAGAAGVGGSAGAARSVSEAGASGVVASGTGVDAADATLVKTDANPGSAAETGIDAPFDAAPKVDAKAQERDSDRV